MEENGCVFLPAAGYRSGSHVVKVGDSGYYWSSTVKSSSKANSVLFYSYSVTPDDYNNSSIGDSVRLVTSAPATITPEKQQDGTYQFTMPAANVTVTAEFEAAAPGGNEKELFNPQNASVDHTWGQFDNPNATWHPATKELSIGILSQGEWQWANQVFLDTGITTLDTTKEYQISFTATASTNDCGGVTFKAFDDNQIAFANQNLSLTTTPFNYVSDWATPSSASTNGLIIFDFGWDLAQTVTITNISIKERTTETSPVEVTTWSALQEAINAAPGDLTTPATATTNIKLTQDLTAPAEGGAAITIPAGKNITLDLNGHVLNAGGGKFSVIYLDDGAQLTLIDSTPTTEHYFTVGDDGLWTLTDTKTENTKTVKGGVITGGRGRLDASGKWSNGGGVIIDNQDAKSTFTMNGGTICGNTATYGGGVLLFGEGNANDTVFNMNGSTVCGNTAEYGGGVFIMTAGLVYLGGTTVIKPLPAILLTSKKTAAPISERQHW